VAVDLPFDPTTLDFYTDEAPVYVASGHGGRSAHLDAFLARLRPGASILELGCGGGRDSEAMIARGFRVDPTDGVAAMAAKAAERLGSPVRVARFDQIDAVEAYDAVWAHASLLHVPRATLPRVLASVWRVLKPGGWHFANFKSGGEEGRDQLGRYYNYLDLDQMRSAYTLSGSWLVHDVRDYEGGGYMGSRGPWVSITVQKA
jgi:SAM-dependent methyltransferase